MFFSKGKKKNKDEKIRPYWHVDAKWICGLILLSLMGLTLLSLSMARATSEKVAKELITNSMAVSYSAYGLDDATEIDNLRAALANEPDGMVEPISGFNITVSADEIEGMTPRETRMYIFGKMAGPIYEEGTDGMASLLSEDSELVPTLGYLALFTEQIHFVLTIVSVVLGVIALLFALLMVHFSAGFGKLASPGVVFFLAGMPGYGTFSFLSTSVAAADKTIDFETAGYMEVFKYMATNMAGGVLETIASTYWFFAMLGALMVVGAMIGGIVRKTRA